MSRGDSVLSLQVSRSLVLYLKRHFVTVMEESISRAMCFQSYFNPPDLHCSAEPPIENNLANGFWQLSQQFKSVRYNL